MSAELLPVDFLWTNLWLDDPAIQTGGYWMLGRDETKGKVEMWPLGRREFVESQLSRPLSEDLR